MVVKANSYPPITFLLLAYNQEKYVRKAVEGAFAQTYSPLEVILSDDCSSDRTFEIMQEMAADYSGPHKIVLNRNDRNLGIGGHVNRLMEMARGDWIIVGAGDDISLPHRTACLVNEYLKGPNETMVIYSDYEGFRSGEDGYYVDARPEPGVLDNVLSMCRNGFGRGHGCSSSWNRRVFDEFGPMCESVMYEDRVIHFRGRLLGQIRHVAEPLVRYRRHEANTVQMFHSKQLVDHARVLKSFVEVCQNNEKDLVKYASSINPTFKEFRLCLRAIRQYKRKLEAYLSIHCGGVRETALGIVLITYYGGNPLQAIKLAYRVLKAKRNATIANP